MTTLRPGSKTKKNASPAMKQASADAAALAQYNKTGTLPTGGGKVFVSDAIDALANMASDSVDLIFGSPPYEDARSYKGLPALTGEAWVDYYFRFYAEACRVSRGAVILVVEGRTKDFSYSATPVLLMADLKRAVACKQCGQIQQIEACNCSGSAGRCVPAFTIRKPPIFMRYGIFGSGGPDYWRNDYEFMIFATRAEVKRLPFADPTAVGLPPKYPPGGNPSHRKSDDSRVASKPYTPPKLANPGNVRDHSEPDTAYEAFLEEVGATNIRRHAVGGGHMGDKSAHGGVAPFPEGLARDVILTFSPPAGVVYDPFVGTGTTPTVAALNGRNFLASDIDAEQIRNTFKRLMTRGVEHVIATY